MAVVDGVPGDLDAVETSEWLEAIDSVLEHDGPDRARHILTRVVERAAARRHRADRDPQHAVRQHDPARARGEAPGRSGARAPASVDRALERDGDGRARQQALIRARRAHRELPVAGDAVRGRLQPLLARVPARATVATSCTSRATPRPATTHGRSWRAASLRSSSTAFARRSSKPGGLSSYPHPWLMPDFWQFSTVSLGIGPITSIYQAQFMKYLQARGLAKTDGRKVWCFVGDGEVDEPETMGSIGLAGRERLDNLIWVVNCNLQRLDGPVRGNGKIIQELESDFRGAGWNVIKVIWGSALGPAAGGGRRRPAGPGDGGVASTASTRRTSRATAPTCASTSSARTRCCSDASRTCRTRRSGCSTAAGSTSRRSTPPITRRFGTPVSRR